MRHVSVVLFLLGYLLSAVAAESIRETELMDPNVIIDDLIESSGADDEDIYTDYYDEEDSFESGSGQPDEDDDEEDDEDDDDLESTMDTPTATLGNELDEDNFPENKIDNELEREDNEIIKPVDLLPDEQEPSNKIPMAVTSHNFFSRTEVVIAVVAGAVVGLVFAVIIVLLVMHVRKNKKGDMSYDTVKKPIYKKAPTIEA